MIKRIIEHIKANKSMNKTSHSCYYCGSREALTLNRLNGIYTCKHCQEIIERTKKRILACC